MDISLDCIYIHGSVEGQLEFPLYYWLLPLGWASHCAEVDCGWTHKKRCFGKYGKIGEDRKRSGTHRAICVSIVKVASHCPQIDPWWTHDYAPAPAPSGICWDAKQFPKGLPKGDICVSIGDQLWHSGRPALRCKTWIAQCIYDLSRFAKFHHSCVHLRSISGQCDWCLH